VRKIRIGLNHIAILSLLLGFISTVEAVTYFVNPNISYDPKVASITSQVDTVSLKYYMEGLQAFQYHNVYAANHDSTAQWLADQFTTMGISDVRRDSFYYTPYLSHESKTYYNVVATMIGLYDTSTVYITGGHYDTAIGVTQDLLDTFYSTGANDNGSGITAVLEMARLLALPGNHPNCTVKFIAFDGEESGRLGSAHYANEAYQQNMNIGLMSNYDCIGSWLSDTLYHSCPEPGAEAFAELLCQTTEWYSNDGTNTIKAILGGINSTDNNSFYELGYPTTNSQEYILPSTIHTVNDSATYINYPAMANIIRGGLGLMATISSYPRVSKPAVLDKGNGSELLATWEPDVVGNIVAHKIYWGRSSGTYTDSVGTGLTEYTIAGLSEDSLYYVGFIAIDDSGKESPVITEVTGTPRITPLSPAGVTAVPMIMSIKLDWQRNLEFDLAGYRIYRKIDQENWDSLNSSLIADTVYTDSVPSVTARYWYRLRAFDAGGNASPLSDSMDSYTYVPAGLSATPVAKGITLNWALDSTRNINSYRLYRKINQNAFDSLAQITYPDTSYTDSVLPGADKYYYRLRAFDYAGNPSRLSDSAYGRPITLDQGILLVDETNNWTSGSWPRDAQQDTFYNYIMAGYHFEQYEYGAVAQKPVLADFGPYSTVAWFADDYAAMLASGAMNDMRNYLDNGGKVWFAGWKPSGDVRNSPTYPADFGSGSILHDNFLISHAELSGASDSFKTATGIKGYPSIIVDSLKYPVTFYGKTMRYIEALTPTGTGDTIYVMDMKNDGSPYEGRACAVRDSGKTVFFGFPLYFMDKEQVKQAAQKIMEEFGEEPTGITEGKDNREQMIGDVLWQNSPNPFSKTTNIRYQLSQTGKVSLKIYNIQGQLVKILDEGYRIKGEYSINWDGKDKNGKRASNGIYFYSLSKRNGIKTNRMILVK